MGRESAQGRPHRVLLSYHNIQLVIFIKLLKPGWGLAWECENPGDTHGGLGYILFYRPFLREPNQVLTEKIEVNFEKVCTGGKGNLSYCRSPPRPCPGRKFLVSRKKGDKTVQRPRALMETAWWGEQEKKKLNTRVRPGIIMEGWTRTPVKTILSIQVHNAYLRLKFNQDIRWTLLTHYQSNKCWVKIILEYRFTPGSRANRRHKAKLGNTIRVRLVKSYWTKTFVLQRILLRKWKDST